ncbi:MAG: DUF4167 domain-containing protein [Methyloceanibacter sp.]
MRQGQQNRRGRGRGRKPQNPLARNFESNGPDVKIRGTAAHIAEKYMSLARDALASGDLISAESYFQHAEHYNRIIMAAQSQFGPQHGGQPGEGGNGGFRPRWNADGSSDDDGSDDDANEGGGDIRAMSGGGDIRGGGGQDRERHQGDREHHGGGHNRGRQGGNGREAMRDSNGSDPADAAQPDDEGASDPVG